jgi:hypothetical protein
MFRIKKNNRKCVAAFFLLLLTVQTFYPAAAYALTSGPSQPEMQKFQPAGTSDMVDLFSGDFKYNIPLFDIDGYPVNLAYHSGMGIEDEAGWVGAGWSLNPGVMNRTMRGLPDDFTGDKNPYDPKDARDVVKTVHHKKDFKKIGGQLVLKPTFAGWEAGKASLHLGVYKDNYYGIGGEIGASLSFSTDKNAASTLTAGLQLTSDTRSGVTLSPSFSLTSNYENCKELNVGSLSGGFSYNTRAGLQQVNLNESMGFNSTTFDEINGDPVSARGLSFNVASFTKYFNQSYTPTIGYNTVVDDKSLNLDLGGVFLGIYVGIGGTGYMHTETNVEPHSTVPAYGYLNYDQGKKNVAAMLDFNREKDGVFMPSTPAIPVPVATEDYFEATSQLGAQQFRPFYNGNYVVFDRTYGSVSKSIGVGLTAGAGNALQGGARVDQDKGSTITRKWVVGNGYAANVEVPYAGSNKAFEGSYFKKAGDMTMTDGSYYDNIKNNATERVAINGKQYYTNFASTQPIMISEDGSKHNVASLRKENRDIRTSTFTCLTAGQAAKYGLDKNLDQYNLDQKVSSLNRIDDASGLPDPTYVVHKAHHISEVSVTDEEGKRMVYGIPVYNKFQEEVSFSVNRQTDAEYEKSRRTGLIKYQSGENTEGNVSGRLNIYDRKVIPPYAVSYLLTGILSPDYVDKKGDGITDDDAGTAIKFGYKRQADSYKWRAPYGDGVANYNEGFLSDPKDDKASYLYGEKEVWYLQCISGKTLVAQFFTTDRDDALGVTDDNGTQNSSLRLQKLDSIRVFSKADLVKDRSNAVPIKVVHFQYDYSLVPAIPNSATGEGKLTLKKVWFSFGTNHRGESNPYQFGYDNQQLIKDKIQGLPANTDLTEVADKYTPRQSDRWGTYKQSFYNRVGTDGQPKLNNSEFPYALQVTDNNSAYDERALADALASKWQMNTIQTPTGAVINVTYESDDYSYVQDRKAMIMCPLSGVGNLNSNSGLIEANQIYVKLPVAVTTEEFKRYYLAGPDGQPRSNIFFKVYTDVDNKNHYEYVYGYAEIDVNGISANGHNVAIPLKKINNYNPIAKTAWQLLQTDLPQLAYENYDNSDESSFGGDVSAAVRSIIQSFANLGELFSPFDKTANSKHFADKVKLEQSMIRLSYPVGKPNGKSDHPTYGKLGGGARVRQMSISDEWATMSGTTGVRTSTYGLQYDYTTTDDNGNLISSGVAAYEPQIGNEENPFHEPINYTEKVEWGQDRYHFIEKPFCESYFPAPSVGYSRVKVVPYGEDRSVTPSVQHANTGYTVSEFYTAKDFPTHVDYTTLDKENYQNNITLMLFASSFIDRETTSQGFTVSLNDMHGKLKATKIYDKADAVVSSEEYFYNVEDDKAPQQKLNNKVLMMDKDGNIAQDGKVMGTDAELVTDVRESISSSAGTSIGTYAGVSFAFIPIPFSGLNYNGTASLRSYNSVAYLKVIHQYGILKAIRTTKNGSSRTATNLLWDGKTGEVLLVQSQNEFNDYIYTFHYPAYMAFDGMGSAYENAGAVFLAFKTGTDGKFVADASHPDYSDYVNSGDELVDINQGHSVKGWFIVSSGAKRLIDQDGNFIAADGTFLVIRPGRRNMLDASAGSVVTMNNPLVLANGSYQIQLDVSKRILEAKAVNYKDEWAVPVPPKNVLTSYEDTHTDCIMDMVRGAIIKILPALPPLGGNPRRGIFAASSESYTAGDMLSCPDPYDNQCIQCTQPGSFLNGHSASEFPFYENQVHFSGAFLRNYSLFSNDVAHVGDYQIVFDNVTSAFNTLVNGNYTEAEMANLLTQFYTFVKISDNHYAIRVYTETDHTDILTFHVIGAQIPGYVCQDPLDHVINPYYQSVKGNWRPYGSYAYHVDRTQVPGNLQQEGGTNIRKSGYYANFTPYWILSGHNLTFNGTSGTPLDTRWIFAQKPIHYDLQGNEVENVDALDRYRAALYGYHGSYATAVASDARHNEIAFDGFEDYFFDLEKKQDPPPVPAPCPQARHLDFGLVEQGGGVCNGSNCIVAGKGHSGNYGLRLNQDLEVIKPAGLQAPSDNILGFDDIGRYLLKGNELANGFAPVNFDNRQYLLSLWVDDGTIKEDDVTPTDPSPYINNFEIRINGSAQNVAGKPRTVVGRWKKVDIIFTAGPTFDLVLSPQGTVYIDDLRIQPLSAQMKSFVYDDQSLRLTAQLDENNFTTFYEYDSEGVLVRIKKETERGVMTIKESRQSISKPRTQP